MAVIEAGLRFHLTRRGAGQEDFPDTELVTREIADYLAWGIIQQFELEP